MKSENVAIGSKDAPLKTKRQFYYIAFERTEGNPDKTYICGYGSTKRAAIKAARQKFGDDKDLEVCMASQALCEAFVERGGSVRFTIARNGRASLA